MFELGDRSLRRAVRGCHRGATPVLEDPATLDPHRARGGLGYDRGKGSREVYAHGILEFGALSLGLWLWLMGGNTSWDLVPLLKASEPA